MCVSANSHNQVIYLQASHHYHITLIMKSDFYQSGVCVCVCTMADLAASDREVGKDAVLVVLVSRVRLQTLHITVNHLQHRHRVTGSADPQS